MSAAIEVDEYTADPADTFDDAAVDYLAPLVPFYKIASADIAKRTAMEVSLMPPVAGDLTVSEFASLLDYIERLSKP